MRRDEPASRRRADTSKIPEIADPPYRSKMLSHQRGSLNFGVKSSITAVCYEPWKTTSRKNPRERCTGAYKLSIVVWDLETAVEKTHQIMNDPLTFRRFYLLEKPALRIFWRERVFPSPDVDMASLVVAGRLLSSMTEVILLWPAAAILFWYQWIKWLRSWTEMHWA